MPSYSPLRPRTTGASTWKRVPSGSCSTRSTICCGVWRVMTPAAVRAVRDADARVEQAQVVVDLGDRADGRARVARRRLLVDRDRRRQALDEVDVGLVHLAEELARVRRQRLDVAALTLGVDRVERERRLPRTRQAGEHDRAGRAAGRCRRSRRLCSRAPRTEITFGSPAGTIGGGLRATFGATAASSHDFAVASAVFALAAAFFGTALARSTSPSLAWRRRGARRRAAGCRSPLRHCLSSLLPSNRCLGYSGRASEVSSRP